ncbi:MAG: nucleotide exchange factor GrpE [Anaerolineaceae bacterium]
MNNFFKKKKTIAENSIPSSSNNDEWKSLFKNISVIDDGLIHAQEANNNLHARLSRVLEAFNRISEQQGNILVDLIKILDYCVNLDPITPEIEGIQAQIASILKDQGVTIWSPSIGELMPEHCEPIAVKETNEYGAQTVLEVISPGYLWGDTILLRRPRVVLSQLPKPEEIKSPPAGKTEIPSKRRRRSTAKNESEVKSESSIQTEDQAAKTSKKESKVEEGQSTQKKEKNKKVADMAVHWKKSSVKHDNDGEKDG